LSRAETATYLSEPVFTPELLVEPGMPSIGDMRLDLSTPGMEYVWYDCTGDLALE
jgi:hypothetical protein